MSSHAHVRRVAGLLVFLIIVGFTAQRMLQPESFGELGHYRASSLNELTRKAPVHQTREVCATCHGKIEQLHQKDVHWRIQCEVCHGPGLEHVRHHQSSPATTAAPIDGDGHMPTSYTRDGCLLCHRKLAARPSDFAQIDPREHYDFLRVTDSGTPCIECHSPHEPLFLQEPVHEARLHPVIFECNDCHASTPEQSHKSVPDHPTIFVCADCHPSVVHDFAKHQHSFLRCTACHLFHPEDGISGRVYLNGGRRFCLLCHERKAFKDDTMPQIDLVPHIEEKAPIMRRDPERLLEDPTACLQCHFDYIHDTSLIRRLQEQER